MSTRPAENRTVLLTGVSGQVGSELRHVLSQNFDVLALDRSKLDLSSAAAIRELIATVRPRWLVNPAAYTAVDRAETDRASAFAINADAPRIMAGEAAQQGIPMLHFSTDYVFSGEGTEPWRESDVPRPINVYGESKLAGEQGILAARAASIILRTSWVYNSSGKNFLLTMLKLAGERNELRIVDDQVGSPTSAASLARLAHHVMMVCEQQAHAQNINVVEAVAQFGGTYHACDAGFTSWYGFAKEIFAIATTMGLLTRTPELCSIPTAEYVTPARRPLNSRLNNTHLQERFGYAMPAWQQSTEEVLRSLNT